MLLPGTCSQPTAHAFVFHHTPGRFSSLLQCDAKAGSRLKRTALEALSDPPDFDVPEREPRPAELQCIRAGAQLTPEQQKAQQLQLPLTQPVRLGPGSPSPRKLMMAVMAAQTWQELEAAVYQKQHLLALQEPTAQQQEGLTPVSTLVATQHFSQMQQLTASQQQQQQQQQPSEPLEQQQQQQPAEPLEQQQQQRMSLQQQPLQPPYQQQQQLPSQAPPTQRKARRKQPVPVLNAPASSLLAGSSDSSSSSSSSSNSGDAAVVVNSSATVKQQQPLPMSAAAQIPTNFQQEQRQQQQRASSPLLNALHVTAAFRRLPDLLDQHRGPLQPAEKQRVAALIGCLCQSSLRHAQDLSLDPAGVALVLRALSKLGHRDADLLRELQFAAAARMDEFSSKDVAVVLTALANLQTMPEEALITALERHLNSSLSFLSGQSLANTIWALAKIQDTSRLATHQGRFAVQQQDPLLQDHMPSTQPSGPLGASGQTVLHKDVGDGQDGQLKEAATQSNQQGFVSWQLMQGLLVQSEQQMQLLEGRDLAQVVWGLAKLGACPNKAWKQSLLSATSSKLPGLSIQDLCNLSAALPSLNVLPDQAWIDTLCRCATVKMWMAKAIGVHSLLQGLLRLKQAQQKAARKAAAKKQRQQMRQTERHQQQLATAAAQQGEGVTQQKQHSALAHEATAEATTDATADATAIARATAAAGSGVIDRDPTQPTDQVGQTPLVQVGDAAAAAAVSAPMLSAATLAELRLLQAAVRWLEAHPGALRPFQVVGVITALAELLPDSSEVALQQQRVQDQAMKQSQQAQCAPDGHSHQHAHDSHQGQLHQQTPGSPGVQLCESPRPRNTGAEHQVQSDPADQGNKPKAASAGSVQRPSSKKAAEWQRMYSRVVTPLRRLVAQWEPEVEVLNQGMGKGRLARFFPLKWAQLVDKCSSGSSSQAAGRSGQGQQ